MNPSEQADLFAQRLADAFSAARDEIAQTVERLVAGGASPEQVVAELADPAFRAEVGLDRETLAALFEDGAVRVLAAAPAAVITPEMLDALTTIGQDSFIAQADRYWSVLQKELTSAVVTGNTASLRETLRGIDGLRTDQIEAAFNTTLNTYSRSVGAEVARNDPPDTLYVAEGPVDEKTRPLCVAAVAAGPMTRDEWEQRYPGYMIDGGGYNCRHQVVPVRSAFDVNSEYAQERLAALRKKENWREPVSVQQAARERADG